MSAHAELDLARSLVEQLAVSLSAPPDDRDALLRSLALTGRLARVTDSIGARLGAEVARHSTDPQDSLATRAGERSPSALVASTVGISPRTAATWVAVGTVLAPPQQPHRAAAPRGAPGGGCRHHRRCRGSH
jgi:hypothetical protein